MLLMIDNYDSFTYNLVQYLRELGAQVQVLRNDAHDVASIEHMAPDAIIISPGPGTPTDAGISMSLIAQLHDRCPVLGVCLGHQAIGCVYGAKITQAAEIMHGKLSAVHHKGIGVFQDLPSPFQVTRYHSLVLDKSSLPDELEITAWTTDEHGEMGEIMGIRHREYSIEGVQFHPEAIMTEHGHALLKNFLNRCELATTAPPKSPAQPTSAHAQG